MRRKTWDPISRSKLIAFGLGVAVFLIVVFASPPGFVAVLDFANLLFHEAGHPIFGILNERLGVYGGTLGQLTFPAILMTSFWRKAQPVPFATATIWFFENFLNIARYMADSRALQLPLVGGGDHDWNEIFFRWNLLSHDTLIAAITRTLGWIGIISPSSGSAGAHIKTAGIQPRPPGALTGKAKQPACDLVPPGTN